MIDTICYKIDLCLCGQDSVSTVCPIVLNNTIKTCSENAVSLAWIICGASALITLIIVGGILIWQCARNKHAEKENETNFNHEKEIWNHEKDDRDYEKVKKEKERDIELEDRTVKREKEYMMKLLDLGEKLQQKGGGLNDTDMEYIKYMAKLTGIDNEE